MIILSVNDVLQDSDSDNIYRILWIDEGGIIAYLIDVNDDSSLPYVQKTSEIRELIVSGSLLKLKDFHNSYFNNKMTDNQVKHRHKAWTMIKDVVELEPDIYQRERRGKIVRNLVKEKGYNRKTVYRNLRRYWQRGKTIAALTPDYRNSGGKGKEKLLSNKKVGRPRSYDSIGKNVDQEVKDNIKEAINKYYLSSKKNSLAFAYRKMIQKHYAADVYYEDGEEKILLKDEDNTPSERQFRYWYEKEFNVERTISRRYGKKAFQRDHRPILGSSTYETFGPGSRFQIDATIGNVYLVSTYNSNWIIGRPVIYFVMDVYSRMITGLYIGLEGPSYIGAMMALENASTNKVEFCKRYDITISESQWACEHLPETIIADNAEIKSTKLEPYVKGLNVKVENHSAYRPELKGIVEKMFDTAQNKLKPMLPGYVDTDFRERGAEDYRLKAKLTIEQFTKVVIRFVLHHNNNNIMKNYLQNEEMIKAGIKSTPREIWDWGITNRAGKLKTAPRDTIRFYLMPTGEARVTHKGIAFNGMLYSCEKAIKDSWFALARSNQRGTWKVSVSYDVRDVTNIYLHDDEKLFEVCSLLDHQERYKNKSLDEVKDLRERESHDVKKYKHSTLENEVNFLSVVEDIIEESVKEANQNQTPLENTSKAKKTGDIRKNRASEKNTNRKKEVFALDSDQTKTDNYHSSGDFEKVQPNNNSEENYDLPSVREMFRKRRRDK